MKSNDGHPELETRCWADLGEAGLSHSSEDLVSCLVTFPRWWNETQLPQPLGQALCRTSLLLSGVRCSCAWHNTRVVSESAWWHLLIPIWYCIFLSILQGLVQVSLQESCAYVVFSPISLACPPQGPYCWFGSFLSKSMCVLHVSFLSGDITLYCKRLH